MAAYSHLLSLQLLRGPALVAIVGCHALVRVGSRGRMRALLGAVLLLVGLAMSAPVHTPSALAAIAVLVCALAALFWSASSVRADLSAVFTLGLPLTAGMWFS